MSWDDQPAADRVRWVAESLSQPRTAHWVATEADVSPATAQKYLEKLAENRRLRQIDDGEYTLYTPDRISQYLDDVREVYDNHTADDLATSLSTMQTQIDAWQAEYNVTTPNELRATICDVSREQGEHRRDIALEWEHIVARIDIIEDALTLYDRFPSHRRAVV